MRIINSILNLIKFTSANEKMALIFLFIFPWILFFFEQPQKKIAGPRENNIHIGLGFFFIGLGLSLGIVFLSLFYREAQKRKRDSIVE